MTGSGNDNPSFCSRCGNAIHLGERFCGNCGAPVSVVSDSSRPHALLFIGITVAVLLLVGGGVALAFGERLGFAGDPEPVSQPVPAPEETTATRDETEPVAEPEPTEEAELPEPQNEEPSYTEAPQGETFEQEFVTRYYDAVAAEDWYTTYSLLDSSSQARFTEAEWVEAQQARVGATGAPPPTSATLQSVSGEGAGFTGGVLLTYSDGTSETVTIQTVYEDGGLRRYLTEGDVSYLEGLVGEAPESGLAAAIEQFVYGYYAAVEAEDWATTYSMLDAGGQAAFTEEEWIERQETRQAVSGPPSPVVEVSVAAPESGYPPVGTATVTFASGEVVEVTVAHPHGEDAQFDRVLTDDEIAYLRSL